MFCDFDRPALILRIYGKGRPVLPQDAEWEALAAHFTILPGTRQIFLIDVESVQGSCGWGVRRKGTRAVRDGPGLAVTAARPGTATLGPAAAPRGPRRPIVNPQRAALLPPA